MQNLAFNSYWNYSIMFLRVHTVNGKKKKLQSLSWNFVDFLSQA